MFTSANLNSHYFKYADDTTLVGLLSNDETDYRNDTIMLFYLICMYLSYNIGLLFLAYFIPVLDLFLQLFT